MTNLKTHPTFDSQKILDIGSDVLRQEIEAIEATSKLLDHTFSEAVNMLTTSRQARVIVSGMGKSGHIAKKIAATLASTGQPAMFVHPAEANHGDLGMITADDRLLLLSNSGESTELRPMLEYAKRFKIPTVAITQNPNSTLAKYADITLLLGNVKEACPMGLAPTTSTTMALALGDALAVAILSVRGFSSKDFKMFHPGGKLGQQLAYVEMFMHSGGALPLVNEDTKMHEVLIEMTQKSFGCVGILNNLGVCVGIITDGDLRRHMEANILNKTASQIMSCSPIMIQPHTLMSEAISIMNEKGITSLFVAENLDEPKPCGLLHIHDCLRAGVA